MSIDPFDIEWVENDPLERDVIMLKSIIDARELVGKHSTTEEYLSPTDVRDVVKDPDRIDESAQSPTRDVYYKKDEERIHPYARAVVEFKDDEKRGIVISWSRYKVPASSYGIKWRKDQ